MVKRRYRVIREHEPSCPRSLVLKTGDKVKVGREDPEMPGWFWCTNADGVAAWVPGNYFEEKEGVGILLVDYDSTEHRVVVGEELLCVKEERGWLWCVNRKGKHGWVPAGKVEGIAPKSSHL